METRFAVECTASSETQCDGRPTPTNPVVAVAQSEESVSLVRWCAADDTGRLPDEGSYLTLLVRCVEIPVLGNEGEISGVLCGYVSVAVVLRSASEADQGAAVHGSNLGTLSFPKVASPREAPFGVTKIVIADTGGGIFGDALRRAFKTACATAGIRGREADGSRQARQFAGVDAGGAEIEPDIVVLSDLLDRADRAAQRW